MRSNPQARAFIGDSGSDTMATCTADVPFIGYTNRPEKRSPLHYTSSLELNASSWGTAGAGR